MKDGKAGQNRTYWLCAITVWAYVVCAHAEPVRPAPYHQPNAGENQSGRRAASPAGVSQSLAVPSTSTLGNWISLGPAPTFSAQVAVPPNNPVCGAIQTVAAHPSNPDILYIGSVNGGIWRTTNATAASPDWTPLTDTLPSLSIGALEFDPTDATSQTLIAASARVSSFGAEGGRLIGVLRSIDGGNSWTMLGTDTFANENLTSVAGRGNVLLAASDSTWAGGNGSGLFRSTNAGVSFFLVSGVAGTGLPAGSVSDVVGDPGNPSRFFAGVIDPFLGTGLGVFRSDDAGAHWIDVTEGITDISDLTFKIEMAIHSGSAGTSLYVGIINDTLVPPGDYELAGIYRSSNLGVSWTLMDVPQTHSEGQGLLHFSIAADPVSPTIVYVGGDSIDDFPFTGNLFRGDASLAPGSQFAKIVDANAGNTTPHADSREMVFDANGNLIETDDGGIYRRSLPQSSAGTWSSVIGNLAVMEAHDVAYDRVANVAMIGTQDNGTQIQSHSGSSVWTMIQGGDGGDVAIDDTSIPNHSIRYGSSQYLGNFFRDTYDAANNRVRSDSPALAVTNGPPLEPQFVTPVKLSKADPTRLVIGGANSIYESFDQGDTLYAVLGGTLGPDVVLAYGGFLANVPYPEVLYAGSGSTVLLRTTNIVTAYTVASGTVLSIVSQADADAKAHQIACDDATSLCQVTNLGPFYNLPQTCTVACGGGSKTSTVGAGVFVGLDADLRAYSLACDNATAICSGRPLFLNTAQTCILNCRPGNLTPTATAFPGAKVQGIVLDSKDWHRAFVMDSSAVYVTPDAGRTWTDITGNLTGVGRLRCLEFVNFPCSDGLVVGTDTGVYRCLDEDLGEWSKLGAGLPNAPAYDLAFNPRAHVLVVGTLGRGAWRFDVQTNSAKISFLDTPLAFADTPVGSSSGDVLTLCSSCTDDLVVQSITSSDPQFQIIPPASGFPVTIGADHCLSVAVQFTPAAPGSQSTTFTITSNDPLSPASTVQGFGRSPGLRVAIYGAEQDFHNGDVKAKVVGSGLLAASQVDVVSAASPAPVPSLAQLRAYNAVLVYSNDRFTDAAAMGNVLADYVDSGGGVVVATHSFSSDGFSGLSGRLVSSGYLPFTTGAPRFSSHLTLVKDLPDHVLLQNVSAFDGGLGSTRDAVTLVGGATLVAHWSDGTPLLASAGVASNRVVGLNFWPPSTDSDPFGWQSGGDGGRIMANALLWAAGQINGSVGPCSGMTVINFDDFVAPADFPETTRLTNRYQAQGATFAGPGNLDGGAVLNEGSLFSVTGYSGHNVLAFNTAGRMSGGGIPRGPESISFAVPMATVSMLAGTGLDPGHSLTLTAYNATNAVLASSSIILAAQMTLVQVTAEGSQSVCMIPHGANWG